MSLGYEQFDKRTARTESIVEKVSGAEIGLRGSLYVHVHYLPDSREVVRVMLSERGKDGSTLDNVLSALGTRLTAILKTIAAKGEG